MYAPVLLFVLVARALLGHMELECSTEKGGADSSSASTSFLNQNKELVLQQEVPRSKDADADADTFTTLHILFFENSGPSSSSHASRILLPQIKDMSTPRVTASIYGAGYEFQGFATKQQAVMPILQAMIQEEDREIREEAKKGHPDAGVTRKRHRRIVVISDARDVLLNIPNTTLRASNLAEEAVDEFIRQFDALTMSSSSLLHADDDSFHGPVVISAEAQCCMNSMTHNLPHAFYFANGTRRERACMHTETGCDWLGFNASVPWSAMMEARAAVVLADRHRRNATLNASSLTKDGLYQDVYLNSGFTAGTPRSLYRLLQRGSMAPDEDDQGALTGYWYWNPNDIVLDYGQTMIGNSRFVRQANRHEGCVFDVFPSEATNGTTITTKQIVHTETGTTPLFLHNPGKYWECQEAMGRRLGLSEPFH